jgi:integrase/recombinase XerD
MSKKLLIKLNEDLKLAGYKKRSCQSYVRAVRQLYNFWSRPLEELEEQHVREYWLHCKDELLSCSILINIRTRGVNQSPYSLSAVTRGLT